MNRWSRRGLITAGVIGGTALVVGVAIRPGNRNTKVESLFADEEGKLITSWVKVDPSNVITAIVPHAEMGQGTHSTLAQMLAEEMDIPWSHVRVEEAPAHEEYANYPLGKGFLLGDSQIPSILMGTLDGAFFQLSKLVDLQITGGSTSIRLTGNYGTRVAGAAAREMLIETAAEQWEVDSKSLAIRDGLVTDLTGSKVAPLYEFAAAAGKLTPPSKPKLKKPEDFTYIGQSLPRLDIPPKVDGSATYSIDVELPGMRYAAIKHAPVFGAKVETLDPPPSKDGLRLVNLENAIAVVADSYWEAENTLREIPIVWSKSPSDDVTDRSLIESFSSVVSSPTTKFKKDHSSGDPTEAMQVSSKQIEATYFTPHLAHATMEPLNCTASVKKDSCEVWVGSQNPLGLRAEVAKELNFDKSQVTVQNCYLGGGFGRRVNTDFALEAVRISNAFKTPIKLIWSREQDIRNDRYRPAVLSKFVGGLDEDNKPTFWMNNYVNKHEPAESTLIPYEIPNQNISWAPSPTHIPFGVWRSVDHSQHAFFTESFIDELAHLAEVDPLEFRMSLLSNQPRHRNLLEEVGDMVDWSSQAKPNHGRGIAVVKSFGSIVAEAVEVSIKNDEVSIDKICCAVDAGFAVNPDGLKAQMEGGIVYGLTAALYGEINIKEGSVQQSNFHDYPMVKMHEVPDIEVNIINSGASMGGGGEPGTPPIAPALTNAIYATTGVRIRTLPIFPLQSGRKLSRRKDLV